MMVVSRFPHSYVLNVCETSTMWKMTQNSAVGSRCRNGCLKGPGTTFPKMPLLEQDSFSVALFSFKNMNYLLRYNAVDT